MTFGGFDYVSLADQDDIWFEDKLSRAIDILTGREPGFDCYSSNVVAFWEDDTRKLIDKAQPQHKWDFVFEAAGPGCTYVLKVSVVSELKPLLLSFQEQISKIGLHDWFIYAFSRAKGYKWFIDPVPSMLYRQHSSNQVGVNSGFKPNYGAARKFSEVGRFPRRARSSSWLAEWVIVLSVVESSRATRYYGWRQTPSAVGGGSKTDVFSELCVSSYLLLAIDLMHRSSVCVTGANGFVASRVICFLARKGVSKIIGVSRGGNRVLPIGVIVRTVDRLTIDQDWMPIIADVDIVVHCAARVHILNDQTADPLAEFRRVNVEGLCVWLARRRKPGCGVSSS